MFPLLLALSLAAQPAAAAIIDCEAYSAIKNDWCTQAAQVCIDDQGYGCASSLLWCSLAPTAPPGTKGKWLPKTCADGLIAFPDGTCQKGTCESDDDDDDGWTIAAGDCNDLDDSFYPGAPEICDGQDQDCDGVDDNGTFCVDNDGDGWSFLAGDCDDADIASYPGAPGEIPGDGVDTDCDMQDGTGLVDPVLSLEPFGWTLGALPVQVVVDGQPLPLLSTAFADYADAAIDVAPWVTDLDFPVVSLWTGLDTDFYASELALSDASGDLVVLETSAGPGDTGAWSHVGPLLGDEEFATFWSVDAAAETDLVLSLDVTGVWSSTDVWILVDGSPVQIPPSAWNGLGQHLVLDVGKYAVGSTDHRIGLRARTALDANAAHVSLTDAAGTVTPYTVAAAGPYDKAGKAHFGNTAARPDDGFTTLVDAAHATAATLQFTPTGFDVDDAVAIVNGGWVRLSPPYADGVPVEVTLTGYADDVRDARISFLPLGSADSLFISDVRLVSGSGLSVDYASVELPLVGEDATTTLVAAPLTGGIGGRTWTSAWTPPPIPRGAVCGLSHEPDLPNTCEGLRPAVDGCPLGYVYREGGDRGMPAGEGFAWCEATGNCGFAGLPDCDVGRMPEGLTCGLVHSENQPNEGITCQGVDPLGGSCPAGYGFMHGGDIGWHSGQGYSWCTLNDPAACAGADCVDPGAAGEVCGLGHDGGPTEGATCIGATPVVDQSCPASFSAEFGGDMGAHQGEGFQWCAAQ